MLFAYTALASGLSLIRCHVSVMISSIAYMVTEVSVCISRGSSGTKEGIMAAHAGRINCQANSSHDLRALVVEPEVLYAFPGIVSILLD